MSRFEDALAQFQRGDAAAAERTLVAVLARDPDHFQALQVLAAVRHNRGDIVGALDALDRAVAIAPSDPGLAFNRAVMLSALGRHQLCLDALAIVLNAAPRDGEALLLQGVSLGACGDHAAALASFEASRLDRPDVNAHRAGSLIALRRFEDAASAAERALSKDPRNADAQFHRGVALTALERPCDACAAFDAALLLRDDLAIRAARATALANVARLDEALADINAALVGAPDKPDYLMRRAYVLNAMDRPADAVADYERVLAQRPDDAEAAYGKADALLSLGDFAHGLQAYEARWGLPSALIMATSRAPTWRGEDLAGKTLLLIGEQGFGDLFQFCRFAPLLAERGARVIVQERPQTLTLLRSLQGVEHLVSARDPAPGADFHLYMASVLRAVGMDINTIPASIPYLSAEPDRVAQWRVRVPQSSGQRIGIAWSGIARQATQRWRSLDDTALRDLVGSRANFVSLQLESSSVLDTAQVLQFGAALKDFADLAALIETLDLVISIDTGIAHLAGALGKPVWIMLPFRADWRWLRGCEDTPWYPQARLFRQKRPGDWGDVIDRVHAALQE